MTGKFNAELFLMQLEREEEWFIKALGAVQAAIQIWKARLAEDESLPVQQAEPLPEQPMPAPAPPAPPAPITSISAPVPRMAALEQSSPLEVPVLIQRTPERLKLIRLHYPTHMPVDKVLELFNALPGRRVNKAGLMVIASDLGVRRPGKPSPAPLPAPPADTTMAQAMQHATATAAPTRPTAATSFLVQPEAPPAPKPPPPSAAATPRPLPSAPAPAPSRAAAPQPAGRMQTLMAVSQAIAAKPKPKSDDEGPIVATFGTVAAWAGHRGIQFMTWDDLPKVNRKREDHLLRPFGRLFWKRP